MYFLKKFLCLKFLSYSLSFILMFCFLLSTFLSLSIFISFNLFKINSTQTLEPLTTVEFNANYFKDNQIDMDTVKITNPNVEEYEKLAQQPEVKSFELNLIDTLLTPTLKDMEVVEKFGLGLFNLKGVSNNFFYDIRFNNININQGRVFNNFELKNGKNSIILSDIIAKNNMLKVGENIDIEICNPSNPKEKYKQQFTLIGTFNPISKIGKKYIVEKEIPELLKDFIHHDHEDNHNENQHSTISLKTEFEHTESLQKFFLFEDLNTIYLPNFAAEKLNRNLAKKFGSKYSSMDYQAAFILNSDNKIKNFKNKAKSLLPEYFIIYDIHDSYRSWMPTAIKNETFFGIVSIVLLILSMIIFSFIIIFNIFFEKKYIYYYMVLGIEHKKIENNISKKYLVFLLLNFASVIFLSPVLSKYIISYKLANINSKGKYFFKIQNLSRNLIDSMRSPNDYAVFNIYYFIGVTLTIILFLIVMKITIRCSTRKIIKGVKI